MDPKKLADTIVKEVSDSNTKQFNDMMEAMVAKTMEVSATTARQMVERMAMERAVRGRDITGLNDEQKLSFAKQAQAVYRGDHANALVVKSSDGFKTKANEALIEQQDNRGGYLVQPEYAAAILRIAASVGTIMRQCQQWPMRTDELGIPNYTGAFLTGAYVGVDLPGTVTGLSFGQAVLVAKLWQLAFTVGNDLMQDASVNLGDWLLTMAGEALANMIDQQGFIGGTVTTAPGPFVGVMNVTGTNLYYNGNSSTSGKTHMTDFNPVTDAAQVVGTLEESILDGAGWYMHRTSWANFRSQLASTSGLPYLFLSGASNELENIPGGGPIKAAGQMAGYPVYTNRWLPSLVTTSVPNTVFAVFGNMKACAFGDKGDMKIAQFTSGSFGGKEIALANQTGIVYKHRHAFVVVLPKAFTVVSTSIS